MLCDNLQGIIPAIVTPLTQYGNLDTDALERIIHRIMAHGGHGVMVLGTTGEGPLHKRKVALDMIENAVRLVGKEGIVVAGTTAVTFDQSIYLADAAYEAGAAAILNIPPFYFNLDEEETVRYYYRYADRSRIPVMIYHMPDVSRHMTGLRTIQMLARHENIVGIKDSSGNFPFFQGLAAAFEKDQNFAVFMGKALLIYSGLAVGARGTMTPAGNLIPEMEQAIYRLFHQGRLEEARTVQDKVFRIFKRLSENGKDLGTNIKGILAVQGTAENYTPDYMKPLEREESGKLYEYMKMVLEES